MTSQSNITRGTSSRNDVDVLAGKKDNSSTSGSGSSNSNRNSNHDSVKIDFTEQNAIDLVGILFDRGYFHDGEVDSDGISTPRSGPNIKKREKKRYDPREASVVLVEKTSDRGGGAFASDRSCYLMTRRRLADKLKREVADTHGRLRAEQASTITGAKLEDVLQCFALDFEDETSLLPSPPLPPSASSSDGANDDDGAVRVIRVGDDLFSERYIDETLIGAVVSTLNSSAEAIVPVSDVARQIFHLPYESTLTLVQNRLVQLPSNSSGDNAIQIRTNGHGSKVLVAGTYLSLLKERVRDAFKALSGPVNIEKYATQNGWEPAWVLEMLHEIQVDLPGELHGDTYVPSCHIQSQKKAVVDFYTSNGYVASEQSHSFGVLFSQMRTYLEEECGAAKCLVLNGELIIHPDMLVSSLEAVIEEAVSAQSVVDLQPHIPQGLLLSHEDDVRSLISDHVLPNVRKSFAAISDDDKADSAISQPPAANVGIASLSGDGAIFVSQALLDAISQTQLPPLIESFAKTRAKVLEDHEAEAASKRRFDHQQQQEEISHLTAKEKRKARKAKSRHQTKVDDDNLNSVPDTDTLPPLNELVYTVVGAYPDLGLVSGDENSGSGDDGVLHSLCRQAFYTDDFRARCDRAVEAERLRLKKERQAKVKLVAAGAGRQQSAVAVEDVQVSFEDPTCFAAACYLLQGMATFLEYASECAAAAAAPIEDEKVADAVSQEGPAASSKFILQEADLNQLERDMLVGCCADFTRRITQYALLRNEVGDEMFSFEGTSQGDDKEGQESSLPHFCSPVNLATRRYPPIFLSCRPSGSEGADDGEKLPHDPLKVLRNVLPVTSGTALARQWILCGGNCHQGGRKPGDFPGFLTHAEENALTICGLPFKKFDKKAKKQFLNARRQLLMQQLEVEIDPEVVLDLCVMLLFQLVKNHIVFGSCLRGPILKTLTQERKISEEVSAELLQLADVLEKGSRVEPELVQRVKDCASKGSRSKQ